MAARMTDIRRVLIVEDEPLIAMMLEDFLESLGYDIAGTADTVADALAIIERGELDAAISDVNLRGGEKSWPIADALAAKNIPFVLASGGSQGGIADAYRGRPTLDKPFTMDAVKKALEALG
jgi:CheY-like chemotaxis protein